jgi:hypothetical protein
MIKDACEARDLRQTPAAQAVHKSTDPKVRAMSRLNRVRGRPFQAGNPGRPRGSRNKTTRIIQQLAERQAEQLTQKALELALSGDGASLRMLMDRLWPLRKSQPVNFEMPNIKTSEDVRGALASIWTAIADGRLTPDEAHALSSIIDRSVQAAEVGDILKRIDDLENEGDQRNETGDPKTA